MRVIRILNEKQDFLQILLHPETAPVLGGRYAAPFLEEGRKMMIIGKIQVVGNFLDGHGRMAQQVHGDLQPQGKVIVIRRGLIFPLEHIVGPGVGEMGVGGDFVDMQGAVDILLDEAFHGKSRGSLLLMADQHFRK